jgi:hypothetical protein
MGDCAETTIPWVELWHAVPVTTGNSNEQRTCPLAQQPPHQVTFYTRSGLSLKFTLGQGQEVSTCQRTVGAVCALELGGDLARLSRIVTENK